MYNGSECDSIEYLYTNVISSGYRYILSIRSTNFLRGLIVLSVLKDVLIFDF